MVCVVLFPAVLNSSDTSGVDSGDGDCISPQVVVYDAPYLDPPLARLPGAASPTSIGLIMIINVCLQLLVMIPGARRAPTCQKSLP